MCKIISCGLPFVSEMVNAFPDLLGEKQLKAAEIAKTIDFKKYMEGIINSSNLRLPVG
jgi:uncharacterized protein YkvS